MFCIKKHYEHLKFKIKFDFLIYEIMILFLDFERHDDDELGFRKNDIITIISRKDEHCWVGELNSLRGEFILDK